MQRRILLVLQEADGGLLPFEVRRKLGACDSSNVRRAIRDLIDRNLVERDQGRLALTFWEGMRAAYLLHGPYEVSDPLKEIREFRSEMEAAMAVIREQHEEERRAIREREALWEEPERTLERRRQPGLNQLRVVVTLVRYAGDPQLGLPKGAVRRIAGGEKANMLRAIRSLLRRGTLQQSKDGERLRFTTWKTSLLWDWVPYAVSPPLDDANARVVLEDFGESGGVA